MAAAPEFDMQLVHDRATNILHIARLALEAAVHRRRYEPDLDVHDTLFHRPLACFVTLRRRGDDELRGCIGTFDDTHRFIDNLVAMAGASARDPRFVMDPVRADELDRLRIEVSVLTPMQPVDDPLTMRPGIDGIHIVAPRRGQPLSGCFLPDVATEMGWDAATTLSMCCRHKMGLADDAWKPPTDLKFYTFQSIKVVEP